MVLMNNEQLNSSGEDIGNIPPSLLCATDEDIAQKKRSRRFTNKLKAFLRTSASGIRSRSSSFLSLDEGQRPRSCSSPSPVVDDEMAGSAMDTAAATASISGAKIMKEGWLQKRGEHIKNWRPRYFILWDNGVFLGFKSKPDESYHDPLNNFTVKDCQVRKTDKPKPNTFLVRGLQLTNVVERMFLSESSEDR